MTNSELIEKILDEWHAALYGDLESGAAWLNERTHNKFASTYPNIAAFGEFLSKLEGEINDCL